MATSPDKKGDLLLSLSFTAFTALAFLGFKSLGHDFLAYAVSTPAAFLAYAYMRSYLKPTPSLP